MSSPSQIQICSSLAPISKTTIAMGLLDCIYKLFMNQRSFFIGRHYHDPIYSSNEINTSKFTLKTFLPHCLFQQLIKFTNIYFLIIAIIQSIPQISPLTIRISVWIPYLFVIGSSMIREYMENRQRVFSDREINSRRCQVYREGAWLDVVWGEIRVGDIIKVVQGQIIPADSVILDTSNHGYCYIETSTLDGQKGLKKKVSLKETIGYYDENEHIFRIEGQIKAQSPNDNFFEFEGSLLLQNELLRLTIDQLLLRSSRLVFTEWVVLTVCYTGHDTKIMQSNNLKKTKISEVQQRCHRMLLIILLVQLVLSLGLMVCSIVHNNQNYSKYWYLKLESDPTLDGILNFFTFIILSNTMIPISLIVTLEFVHFMQAFFIKQDQLMRSKSKWPQVFNSSVNENLGQIQQVFFDKTGTLTKNVLKVKEVQFGGGGALAMYDEYTQQKVVELKEDEAQYYFWLGVVLCHDLVHSEIGSPEDEAMLDYASQKNFEFESVNHNTITVQIKGSDCHFELIDVKPFTSLRQMMSVTVKSTDGRILLFCKGSDKAIKKNRELQFPQYFVEKDFTQNGLREVFIAVKVLSSMQIYARYPADLERNLYTLGKLGLEETLQDGAPYLISSLRKANVKMWVLSGDRLEAVRNVALSSGIITPDYKLVVYDEDAQKVIDNLVMLKRKKALVMEEIGQVEEAMLELAKKCEVVLLGRLTPSQKGRIVEWQSKECITMAVGDGCNDDKMLQVAHVGVGISESKQFFSADYVLPELKGLWRLLFVHGRWSYMRTSEMILYFFYKNMLLTFPQFYFSFVSGFSGQSIYDDWYIGLYNILFTALPLFLTSLIEQDLNYVVRKQDTPNTNQQPNKLQLDDSTKDSNYQDLTLKDSRLPPQYVEDQDLKRLFPKLYYVGQMNQLFTYKQFGFYCISGSVYGLIFFSYLWLNKGQQLLNVQVMMVVMHFQGQTYDFWSLSLILYTTVIIAVNLKLMLMIRFWTVLSVICIVVFSFGVYIAGVFLFDHIDYLHTYQISMGDIEQLDIYVILVLFASMVFGLEYLRKLCTHYTTQDYLKELKVSLSANRLKEEVSLLEAMNHKGELDIAATKRYDNYISDQISSYLNERNADELDNPEGKVAGKYSIYDNDNHHL